jgi:hypothetical protein
MCKEHPPTPVINAAPCMHHLQPTADLHPSQAAADHSHSRPQVSKHMGKHSQRPPVRKAAPLRATNCAVSLIRSRSSAVRPSGTCTWPQKQSSAASREIQTGKRHHALPLTNI